MGGVRRDRSSRIDSPNPRSKRADRAFQLYQRHGRPADLTEVFDATAGDLHRLASRLTGGDSQSADDLVQATFLTAIESAQDFDPKKASSGVAGWLTGILKNQAILMQRRARRRPDPARLPEPEPLDPILDAERSELDRRVGESIAALSPTLRPVVHLHVLHGLSAKEIAAVLDRPAGTVRTQVVRGLEKLRALLPVGLAGVLAGLLPSAGFAAVRTAVLKSAAAKASTASVSATATVTGTSVFATTLAFLTMKKGTLALAALALVVMSGLLYADPFGPATPEDVPEGPPAQTAGVGEPNQGESATPTEREIVARSEPVDSQVQETPRTPISTLRGRVFDEFGEPFAGAEVVAWATRSGGPAMANGVFEEKPVASVTSGPAGFYELPWYDNEFGLAVHVRSEDGFHQLGTRRLTGTVEARELVEGLDLELQRAVEFQGVVLDAQGAPVAAAKIGNARGYTSGGPGFRGIHDVFSQWPVPQEAVTDAQGRFSLIAVADMELHWDVRAEGLQFLRIQHRASDGFLQIQLPDGESIRGSVFRADGSSAAGARVQIGRNRRSAVECDRYGSFVISGLSLDRGSDFLNVIDETSAVFALHPIPEGDTPLQLFLEPSREVTGLVVDAAGQPIPGVRVHAEGERLLELNVVFSERSTWEWAQAADSTISDDEGRFSLPRLYEGEFELTLEHPKDRSVARSMQVSTPTDLGAVELHSAVSDFVNLPIQIVGASGEWEEGFTDLEVRISRPIREGFSRSEVVEIGGDGRGILPGLRRDAEGLSVSADAIGFAYVELTDLRPSDWVGSENPVQLMLLPKRSLRLEVRSVDGEFAQGTVRAYDVVTREHLWVDAGGGARSGGETTYNGPVELRGLPAKPIALVFSPQAGGEPTEMEVDLTEPSDELVSMVVESLPPNVDLGIVALPMELDEDDPLRTRLLDRNEARQIFLEGAQMAEIEDRIALRLIRSSDDFEIATAEATRVGSIVEGEREVPTWSITTRRFDNTGSHAPEMPGPSPMIALGGLLEPMRLEIRCDGFESRTVDIEPSMVGTRTLPDGTTRRVLELVVPIARER